MIQQCNSLLIEFLTEELPPINLYNNIGRVFAKTVVDELRSFMSNSSQYKVICSPRRFGVVINNIFYQENDNEVLKKGPPVKTSLIDNKPTTALLGFMKSIGIDNIDELIVQDGYFFAKKIIIGRLLNDILADVINKALKTLVIGKNMRWAHNDYYFIRPVHNLMILFGSKVVNLNGVKIFGLIPNNYTYGHRFLSQGKIEIEDANDYYTKMQQDGYVISDFNERRKIIIEDLSLNSKSLDLILENNDALLDEVTAIVEYPKVLIGEFDSTYLELPPECLVLSMAKNQKYFALFDHENNLSNKFLFVTNIQTPDYTKIIIGNQRVLDARLADAKFFYDVDKNNSLDYFVTKLDKVIYHDKLGSQLERIKRIQKIALHIGNKLNLNNVNVEKAAYLIKADLMTEMVGEFPELQGTMGKYYAIYHNLDQDIAVALEEYYYPRFSGDKLPSNNLAIVLALADKLETLLGIWGIGLIPTGDKDQYALRRMALGIVRILLQYKLNLMELLQITYDVFQQYNFKQEIIAEIYKFILTRLYNYLSIGGEFNYNHNVIQSIIVNNPEYLEHLPNLLMVLDKFRHNNQDLFNTNKRIENILKKTSYNIEIYIDENLFQHNVEKELYQVITRNSIQLEQFAQLSNWQDYFNVLSSFNEIIHNFFDNVMIMDENLLIRENRINLLARLYFVMNKYCKLSELSV